MTGNVVAIAVSELCPEPLPDAAGKTASGSLPCRRARGQPVGLKSFDVLDHRPDGRNPSRPWSPVKRTLTLTHPASAMTCRPDPSIKLVGGYKDAVEAVEGSTGVR